LPHPGEKEKKDPVEAAYGTDLCSFAFKTIHDPQLGVLTFLRIFKGSIKSGQKLYNVTREKSEKILKIYRPLAEDLEETAQADAGQVVIVSGLKASH